MAKITLNDISSGYLSNSTYNANNTTLEAAIENTLSRDGTAPNQMGANLDMNSYRITNLPDAVANQDPVTLAQAGVIAGVDNPLTQETVGAALYPETAAETSAAVTIVNYYYAPGNVLRYGNNTTPGTTSMTLAAQSAIDVMEVTGGDVIFPDEICAVQGLVVADDSKVTLRGSGPASILKKNDNGVMVTLGKQCTMKSLALDGNGVAYTGTGVLINTGALDNFSWRRITEVDIYETASYCIEFTGNRAGYASQIENCRLVPRTSSVVAAVKMANNGGVVETNGNRMLRNVWSFSQPIADLTDASNTDFVGCHGFLPIFSLTTEKTNITGGRMNVLSTDFTLTGASNTISGCTISTSGGAFLIAAGATNCRVDSSNAMQTSMTITDSSPGLSVGNEIWLPSKAYTPTWTGGSPTIGNGTLNAQYTRNGVNVKVNIQFTAGSTTTYGSGAWSFSLPYTASRSCTGSVFIDDGGTTIYSGACSLLASGTTVRGVTNGSTSAYVGSASPMAWASGDKMQIDIEYIIA